MIGWISGTLITKRMDYCIVAAGGLGYEITMTTRDLAKLGAVGSQVVLYLASMYREDAQMLFGFWDLATKHAFMVLNKANGVGPKMALQVLEVYPVSELSLYCEQENYLAFTRVKGIGPKVAKRLVVDLKGKILYDSCPDMALQSSHSINAAVDALLKLGYKEKRARDMVQAAEGLSVEEIIKSALQKEGTKA